MVLKIIASRYSIEHIKGEDNAWADIVSRWGQQAVDPHIAMKRVTTCAAADVSSPLRSLEDDQFVWSSVADFRDEQFPFRTSSADIDGLVRVEGLLWAPRKANALLKRLMVVAHCGAQGYRRINTMVTASQEHFAVSWLRLVAGQFLRDCLLCSHVKGSKIIQRPCGEPSTATRRNEYVHFDSLWLGESCGTTKYVHVLKDELTHYCDLIAVDSAASITANEAVLDWHKRFGLPEMWVFDSGTHF
ncbi:hypothetical protein CCR75_001465 [Bremia lactucae]|uniref:Integrase zinc-binding domain-containing protein n=1 Tax=Bremia lactucae TaxID=4779 RepID=A0A976IM48_BRELC|nr:hypothetical protein CCR75_001465 [Bremia lactucae]